MALSEVSQVAVDFANWHSLEMTREFEAGRLSLDQLKAYVEFAKGDRRADETNDGYLVRRQLVGTAEGLIKGRDALVKASQALDRIVEAKCGSSMDRSPACQYARGAKEMLEKYIKSNSPDDIAYALDLLFRAGVSGWRPPVGKEREAPQKLDGIRKTVCDPSKGNPACWYAQEPRAVIVKSEERNFFTAAQKDAIARSLRAR